MNNVSVCCIWQWHVRANRTGQCSQAMPRAAVPVYGDRVEREPSRRIPLKGRVRCPPEGRVNSVNVTDIDASRFESAVAIGTQVADSSRLTTAADPLTWWFVASVNASVTSHIYHTGHWNNRAECESRLSTKDPSQTQFSICVKKTAFTFNRPHSTKPSSKGESRVSV